MARRIPLLKRLKIALRRGRPLVWDGDMSSVATSVFEIPTTSRMSIGGQIKLSVSYVCTRGPRRLFGLIPVGQWQRHAYGIRFEGMGKTAHERTPEGIPESVVCYGPIHSTPRRWLMWELTMIRNNRVSDPYSVTTTP